MSAVVTSLEDGQNVATGSSEILYSGNHIEHNVCSEVYRYMDYFRAHLGSCEGAVEIFKT